jgi:O-antigen/teichoic acid export membrane protein
MLARLRSLSGSDTGRAAGMAGAVLAGNVVALGFTVVFARVLGQAGYGSLAALVSTFIILMVPGSALQTTVAREVSAAIAAGDASAGGGVRRWLQRLALLAVAVTVVSVFGRDVVAKVIGVDEHPWGAAGALPAGALWLMLSVERGALQAFQRYRLVGASIVIEQVARLGFGLALVGVGADVSGAFLGTPLALVTVVLALALPLNRQLRGVAPASWAGHRLRDLARRAAVPIAALALVAWLQDGHVIVVKHLASSDDAGAWGAAAVAAKAIMWVAIGLGLYLVPEAARRSRSGEDARGILVRTLGIVAALAVPMLLVFAVAAGPLLSIVFDVHGSAEALPWLGLAMSLLALSYLATQFQLALHRARFIAVLVAAAVAQPLLLLAIGDHLATLAVGLLAIQAVMGAAMLVLALRPPAVAERRVEPYEDRAPSLIEA